MATKAKAQSDAFVHADDLPQEDLGDGISRKILGYGPEIMMVRVWFETGSVGAVHSHPHSQTTFIESGKFEVEIGGEKRIMGAGDSTYMAPGVEHGSVCLEAGVLLDTFSPVREDFLGEGA